MILRMDNFGWYTKPQLLRYYSSKTENGSILVGPYGRGGGPGLRLTGDYADDVTIDGLSPTGSTCIVQADVRISTDDAIGDVLLGIRAGGGFQCTVNRKADGTLGVYNTYPSLAGLIASSSQVFPLGAHVHLGVKAVIAASGSIVIHVWEDGDSAAQVFINASGINTRGLGAGTWDGIHLGSAISAGTTDWSNLMILDASGAVNTDLLGPLDIFARYPDAPGQYAEMSPYSGTDHVDPVDDVTADDDSSYVAASATGLRDVHEFQDAPYPDRVVVGVSLIHVARVGSGSMSLTPMARQAGVDYDGTPVALTSAYQALAKVYNTAPDGSALTPTIFNALQFGAKAA